MKIKVRRIHVLKTWPPFFQDVLEGIKTFELRQDDRDFQVGDALCLKEYDNVRDVYSGRWMSRLVTYKLSGGQFAGIEKGYCILGIGALPPYTVEEIDTAHNKRMAKPARRTGGKA